MKTNYIGKLILLFFILVSAYTQAENAAITIKGRVVDSRNLPVAYSMVTLFNVKTGNIEKGTVCNENGEYQIEKVSKGEYNISVRMMGYEPNENEQLTFDGKNHCIDIIENPSVRFDAEGNAGIKTCAYRSASSGGEQNRSGNFYCSI